MWSVLAVLSLAVVVLGAVGVVSCLVSQQRPVGMGGEPPHSTLPMLALHSGMERLRLEAGVGAGQAGRPERQSSHASHASHARRTVDCAADRAVRLTAVSTDLELDLPPTIALPDGEEHPYGASSRLHIRDAEQESEIYQKCIRPPPNRTVFDGESPPPYRSSSASSASASLGGSGSGGSGSSLLRHPHGPHPPHPALPHPAGLAGLAGLGLPAVIVPSPGRKQDPAAAPLQPALLLAGAASTAKHSTGPVPLPPPGSTASTAGLVRLLSPAAEPRRAPTVPTVRPKASSGTRAAAAASSCRTAHSPAASASADGVDLVNVNSACSAVRDIPGAPRTEPRTHLAGLTMVPCLTESRTELTTCTSATAARTEPSPSPSPSLGLGDAPAAAAGQSPARTRTRSGQELLARPLPRPPV